MPLLWQTDAAKPSACPIGFVARKVGYARIWDVGLPKFDEHGRFHGFFGTICPLDQFEPFARHETPNLSPREREVLRLVSEGNTTATIAAMLGLAARTVDTHVNNAVAR